MNRKASLLNRCLDWRILAVLFAVGVSMAIFAPHLGISVLPLLLLAACPVSMILMMVMMNQPTQQSESNSSHLVSDDLPLDSLLDQDKQLSQLKVSTSAKLKTHRPCAARCAGSAGSMGFILNCDHLLTSPSFADAARVDCSSNPCSRRARTTAFSQIYR